MESSVAEKVRALLASAVAYLALTSDGKDCVKFSAIGAVHKRSPLAFDRVRKVRCNEEQKRFRVGGLELYGAPS